jgi:ABC-2 type transport system ATP-binding protein
MNHPPVPPTTSPTPTTQNTGSVPGGEFGDQSPGAAKPGKPAGESSGTPNSANALEVIALVRRFGALQAVDGVTFTVPQGQLVALLGPNGAGKTSTLDVCTGFARPDAGVVTVFGLDAWRHSAALRPRIGVMLQAGGAHAAARTIEMLEVIARCSARPLDPMWLLTTLGLQDSARTPVRRLSGGQVQRLSLAMALVGRPELLFLDEPTAGMDPQARHLVWDLLRAARSDGVSILLTTHLLDEAELLADRVVIIDRGRVVADGTLAELTGAQRELRFAAAAGLDVELLRLALPDGYQVREISAGRYLVEGDIVPATVATVTSFCARVGIMPGDLQVGRRSLEEVYLDLTGKELRS